MKTKLVNLILAYFLFCSFHSYSQIEHKENFIYNDSIYTIEIQQVFNGQQGYKISVYNENNVARSFYMAELSYSIFKERLFQTIAEKPASGIDKSEKKQTFFSIIDNYKIIENFHKAEYDLSQAPIVGYFILHPDSIPTFPFLHSSYGYGHFGFHKKSPKKCSTTNTTMCISS